MQAGISRRAKCTTRLKLRLNLSSRVSNRPMAARRLLKDVLKPWLEHYGRAGGKPEEEADEA